MKLLAPHKEWDDEFVDLEVVEYDRDDDIQRSDLPDVELVLHGERKTVNVSLSREEYELFKELWEER